MSTTISTPDGSRPPVSHDASNFNVSFNGNKNGPGFAIYIVPSGPPNESQNNAKKENEASDRRNGETTAESASQEGDTRRPQTFGKYSPSVSHTQSYNKTAACTSTKPLILNEAARGKGLLPHVFDKGITPHAKEVKIFRPEKEDIYNWSRAATTKLLELYTSEQYFDRFRDRFTKKKVLWNEIAEYLNREGFAVGVPLTGDQCANKFRNLKKVYIKCQNQNLNINESMRRFEHFSQLHQIFSGPNTYGKILSSVYPHDGRMQRESHSQGEVESTDSQYYGHCRSPTGHESGSVKGNVSEVVDLSHSPVDTKPVIIDTYGVEQTRADPPPTCVTDSDVSGSSMYSLHSMAASHSRPPEEGRKLHQAGSASHADILTVKRRASLHVDQDVPPKIFCLNDSEEDFDDEGSNEPPSHCISGRSTIQAEPAQCGERGIGGPLITSDLDSLIKKHLESRDRAFSNLIKSLAELHDEESKLLSTILHVMEKR